jgi:hypothetical protein
MIKLIILLSFLSAFQTYIKTKFSSNRNENKIFLNRIFFEADEFHPSADFDLKSLQITNLQLKNNLSHLYFLLI